MTAADVCTRFEVKPEAKVWLREKMRPREFVKALLICQQYLPAIDFLAHFLPVRESVWWGCLCMQHVAQGHFTTPEKAAAKAAVEWIMRPEEEERVAARACAEAAGMGSMAGLLAMAVYQTGGNVAPPNATATAAAPFAWAKFVARAVKLASAKAEPAKIIDTQKAYALLAGRIAETSSWFGSEA